MERKAEDYSVHGYPQKDLSSKEKRYPTVKEPDDIEADRGIKQKATHAVIIVNS